MKIVINMSLSFHKLSVSSFSQSLILLICIFNKLDYFLKFFCIRNVMHNIQLFIYMYIVYFIIIHNYLYSCYISFILFAIYLLF